MIVEKRGITEEGFPYMVVILENLGTRNGYVGVFDDSPFFEIYYDDVLTGDNDDYLETISGQISVHGGVTYSGYLGQNIVGARNPYFFGFDCAHLGDGMMTPQEMSQVVNKYLVYSSYHEKNQIITKYKRLYNLMPTRAGEIAKSYEYVLSECLEMSKQLKELEKKYVNN